MPLSLKHQRFVTEYLKDLNATQAAIRAGYSERTAYAQGSRLLKHAEVCAALAKATAKAAAKLEITAEGLISDMDAAKRGAMASAQFSPAIKAIEMLGRSLGMENPFSETVNVNAKVESTAPSLPDLARDLAFLLASGVQALEKDETPPLH